MVTPPINNAKTETTTYSHENFKKEIPIDQKDEQCTAYTTILPPSNINYYDLSPYVNTAEVFHQNIVQLKDEITRILKESNIADPFLLEKALNNELKALTGYDAKIFSIPTPSASEPTSSTPTPTPTSTLSAPTPPILLFQTEIKSTRSASTASTSTALEATLRASTPTSISSSLLSTTTRTERMTTAPASTVPTTSASISTLKSTKLTQTYTTSKTTPTGSAPRTSAQTSPSPTPTASVPTLKSIISRQPIAKTSLTKRKKSTKIKQTQLAPIRSIQTPIASATIPAITSSYKYTSYKSPQYLTEFPPLIQSNAPRPFNQTKQSTTGISTTDTWASSPTLSSPHTSSSPNVSSTTTFESKIQKPATATSQQKAASPTAKTTTAFQQILLPTAIKTTATTPTSALPTVTTAEPHTNTPSRTDPLTETVSTPDQHTASAPTLAASKQNQLKTTVTKIAFQQWKIVYQATLIKEKLSNVLDIQPLFKTLPNATTTILKHQSLKIISTLSTTTLPTTTVPTTTIPTTSLPTLIASAPTAAPIPSLSTPTPLKPTKESTSTHTTKLTTQTVPTTSEPTASAPEISRQTQTSTSTPKNKSTTQPISTLPASAPAASTVPTEAIIAPTVSALTNMDAFLIAPTTLATTPTPTTLSIPTLTSIKSTQTNLTARSYVRSKKTPTINNPTDALTVTNVNIKPQQLQPLKEEIKLQSKEVFILHAAIPTPEILKTQLKNSPTTATTLKTIGMSAIAPLPEPLSINYHITASTANAVIAQPNIAISQSCSPHLAYRKTPVTLSYRTILSSAHIELKSKIYKLKIYLFLLSSCVSLLFS
jgi:hypothetical protein